LRSSASQLYTDIDRRKSFYSLNKISITINEETKLRKSQKLRALKRQDKDAVPIREVPESNDPIKRLKLYNLHVPRRQRPYIVGFRQKEIMFNDKRCRLIMLKNLTTEVEFEKASFEKDSLEKMAFPMSSEMKTPISVVSQAVELLLYSEQNEANLKKLRLI